MAVGTSEAPAKEEGKKEDVEMKSAEEGTPPEEAPKEPEKPREPEEDAADDARERVAAGAVAINAFDATANVMQVPDRNLLMTLTEGGCQYLLASARSTVGVKAGRYVFEVRILQSLSPAEAQGHFRAPQPKQLVRVGVSTAGSELILTQGPDNVSFDSEGYFAHEKRRKKVSQKFSHGETVSVLLNLDPKTAAANTLSLFRNGVRISEPQPLPEHLVGKALYPTITYKNVTLQVNFGPVAQAQLPFRCPMLGSAAKADTETSGQLAPADGACEVVFPVGLPDHGFFDWVDAFVESHPGYIELSDRKLSDWASKSGLWKPKTQGASGSKDKPEMKFGIPNLDDLSVRGVLNAVAPALRRNFVVPELKANLCAEERKGALSRYGLAGYKRTACVIMGEPDEAYKQRVQSLLLADKQARADAERKKKAEEEKRKALLAEKKKKAEEAKKAKELAQKKKEGKEVEEEAKEETKAEEVEETKIEEDAPPVELTEEEKKIVHLKSDTPDLTDQVLAKSYARFTLPTKEEGFDEISFLWQKEAACAELLKSWILEKKLTQRVDDLQPGEWFKGEWSKWTKQVQEWRKRQTEWKDPAKRKALLAKKEETKKKAAEDGGAGAEEAKSADVNVEELDVFTVDDVMDLGNGEPLFSNFAYEDWALLSARFEFYLLIHSFRKDLDDPDRPSFGEKHLAFYYNKYFKKSFSPKTFGVETFPSFVEIIKSTISIADQSGFLVAEVPEDTPHTDFVKVVEDHRRERLRRLDAGDETAQLTFARPLPQQPPRQPPASAPRYAGSWGGRGAGAGNGTGSTYSAQKRPYTAPASGYSSAKQPRTAYSSSYSYGR